MHGTAAYFRSDAHSRGRCSRNTSIHYGAHTHARAHARTVFIDLGPGGNTRFMVSSTTRAGSKFQRGGNSAQITTLRIVGLLVIQLSNPPSFSFFFFLFLSNRKNSFEVVATPEIIFSIMCFLVIVSVSLFPLSFFFQMEKKKIFNGNYL